MNSSRMTPEELIETIAKIRADRAELGVTAYDDIVLVVRRKGPPNGEKVNLLGKYGGPRGEVLSVRQERDGSWSVVARFKCQKILDFFEQHRM